MKIAFYLESISFIRLTVFDVFDLRLCNHTKYQVFDSFDFLKLL